MKMMNNVISVLIIALLSVFNVITVQAQGISYGNIQNQISRDKNGINIFDVKKDSTKAYEGVSIAFGGAFAIQFQGLTDKHTKTDFNKSLTSLTNNFNLPTANLYIDAQLYDGVKMTLDVYLSSRHHNEVWVKGGYLQIDKLDFIKKGFLDDVMKYTTIKIGQMENNYGDAHFRRSDNGNILRNPLIENNIMDAFVTEMGAEVYYLRNGFIGMLGITNGKLDQSPYTDDTSSPSILAKIGFDKQLTPNFRTRITGSLYQNANVESSQLYFGDRGGSRYYGVMSNDAPAIDPITNIPNSNQKDLSRNFATGRINPGFKQRITAIMINPFLKYKDLEFFGTYEYAAGGNTNEDNSTRTWNQFATELLYRFGVNENFYIAAKYNQAKGKFNNDDAKSVTIGRIEAGLGWFLTKNILAKAAYINQNYFGYPVTSDFYNGNFQGYMIEAAISF